MSCLIRLPIAADIGPLTELYNHFIQTTAITFDLAPYTLESRKAEWFDHYRPTGRHQLWIAELNQQVVGYASSSQFRAKAAYNTSVETSIYLHPTAQGQGLGTQLYQTLFDALSTEDVHRAYAGITLPNPESLALHHKFGFEQVGTEHEVGRKFDRYWDVAWLEKKL